MKLKTLGSEVVGRWLGHDEKAEAGPLTTEEQENEIVRERIKSLIAALGLLRSTGSFTTRPVSAFGAEIESKYEGLVQQELDATSKLLEKQEEAAKQASKDLEEEEKASVARKKCIQNAADHGTKMLRFGYGE